MIIIIIIVDYIEKKKYRSNAFECLGDFRERDFFFLPVPRAHNDDLAAIQSRP